MTNFSSQSRSRSPEAVRRLGPVDVLVLSAWCGLAAGELEVAARIVYRALSSTQRLYLMTRHFVWLVPLINLVLFLGLGVLLVLATRLWPASGGMVGPAVDHRPGHLSGADGGWPEDLPGSLVAGRAGGCLPPGPGAGTASGRRAALAGAERSRPAGAGPAPGGRDLGRRLDQAVARRGPSLASGRLAQRALDRAGHRAGGPPEPLRLSTADDPFFGATGPPRDSLRPGSSRGALDPGIAREHVHG